MVLERAATSTGAEAAYARAAVLARRDGWPLDLAHALLLHAGLRRRRTDVRGRAFAHPRGAPALARCPDPGVLAERLGKPRARARRSAGEAPRAASTPS